MNNTLKSLLMVFVGLGLALLIFEIGLRLFLDRQLGDLKTRIVNHEMLGYAFRPNFSFEHPHALNDSLNQFQTNEQGIIVRNSLQNTDEAEQTILFLGDSFLAGVEVPPNAVFTERLADQIEGGCRCINLGVNGYSPARYLLSYRHHRELADSDIVFVVLYVMNEFTDDARLYHGQRLIFDESGQLQRIRPKFDFDNLTAWTATHGAIPLPAELLPEIKKPVITYELLRMSWHRLTPAERFGPRPPLAYRREDYATHRQDLVRNNIYAIFKEKYTGEDWEDITRTQTYLTTLYETIRQDNRQMVVLIMPTAEQIPGQLAGAEDRFQQLNIDPDKALSNRPQATIIELLAPQNIPYLDLYPAFMRAQDRQLFGIEDKHLSPQGHQLVADEIERFLALHFR